MTQEPETVEVEETAPVVTSTTITHVEGHDPLTGEPTLLENVVHVLNTDAPPDVAPEDLPAPVQKPPAYKVQRLTNEELLAAPVGEHKSYPPPEPVNEEEAKPAPQVEVEGQPVSYQLQERDEEGNDVVPTVAPVDGAPEPDLDPENAPAPVAGA